MQPTHEHYRARYYGEHLDFFPGQYVSLQIDHTDESWWIFNEYGEGIEVEPIDVYVLEPWEQ